MSMISELVNELKFYANEYDNSTYGREIGGTKELLKEAADLIEELSKKLASANMERSDRYYKGNRDFVEKLIDKLEEKAELNAIMGYMTAYDVIKECIETVNQLAEEYKDVSDTNVGKWIPVSEKLPEERDWYLAVFKEPYTGFVGLPYIADYLLGEHTAYTTKEGWIIKDCTDGKDSCEYFKELECVAWQPLPQPYKGE